jgi:hypothetical protein
MNYENIRTKSKKENKMQHKNVRLFVATLFCTGLAGIYAQNMKDIDGNV